MKLIKYKFTAFTLIIFITSCDVKLPYRNRQVNEPITLVCTSTLSNAFVKTFEINDSLVILRESPKIGENKEVTYEATANEIEIKWKKVDIYDGHGMNIMKINRQSSMYTKELRNHKVVNNIEKIEGPYYDNGSCEVKKNKF